MVTTVTPYKTVEPPSFRRRYFGFWKVLLVVVVILQIPAWMFIYHRAQPLPITQPGTNKQYALAQTDEAWYTESLGTPIPDRSYRVARATLHALLVDAGLGQRPSRPALRLPQGPEHLCQRAVRGLRHRGGPESRVLLN